MEDLLIRLVISSVSIFLVGKFTHLFEIRDFPSAFFVAIGFGVVNVILGKILHFVFFPIHFITIGISYFLLNGFLLNIAGSFVNGFQKKGCLSSSLAAILITIFTLVLNNLILPI